MKTLPREPALQLWNAWWDELKEEWFKIEVLQDYSGEDASPSLQAWLAGDKQTSIALMPKYGKAWIEMCRRIPARKRRFHIIEKPYTPYLEWEIELYKRMNIPLAGEEVFLVPKESVAHLALPDGDVMIFDNKRIVHNHYSPTGYLEQMDFYEEGDDITTFRNLKSALVKYGTPV